MNLIFARDLNGLIGLDNDIPWHIPEDLKQFRGLTLSHTVIMGRKTFESLDNEPLKGRYNIIVSKSLIPYKGSDLEIIPSLKDLKYAVRKIFLIGGTEIFAEGIHLADKVYETVVLSKVGIPRGSEPTYLPFEMEKLPDWEMDFESNVRTDGVSTYQFREWKRK